MDISSLPPAFLDRMHTMLGASYPAFLAAYQKDIRPSLRVNRQKISPDGLKERLPGLLGRVPWQENAFYFDPDSHPGRHPFHEAGLYYIQEASAMIPASLCPPQSGDRVLDLCAAPGGKSTQAADALGPDGLIVSNEIHPTRASILSHNMERMGIPNAVVLNETPETIADRFPAFFDKVLVDAPCSGEGMFRKEADAVTMWGPETVSMCAERQTDILNQAARTVRPGGYLTYSTCTFAPEENERVLLRFLLAHPDFETVEPQSQAILRSCADGILDRGCPGWIADFDRLTDGCSDEETHRLKAQIRRSVRLFPHHADGEGHFAVLLCRKGTEEAGGSPDTAATLPRQETRPRPHSAEKRGRFSVPDTVLTAFRDFSLETLGQVLPGIPCLFGDRLFLLPSRLSRRENASPDEVLACLDGLKVLRPGLCVGTVRSGGDGRSSPHKDRQNRTQPNRRTGETAHPIRLEPDHALALASPVLPLLSESGRCREAGEKAGSYLHGDTLPSDGGKGWYAVCLDGFPLGWGKSGGGLLKNHLPKGLRRP